MQTYEREHRDFKTDDRLNLLFWMKKYVHTMQCIRDLESFGYTKQQILQEIGILIRTTMWLKRDMDVFNELENILDRLLDKSNVRRMEHLNCEYERITHRMSTCTIL
jgi:hypothetical protein